MSHSTNVISWINKVDDKGLSLVFIKINWKVKWYSVYNTCNKKKYLNCTDVVDRHVIAADQCSCTREDNIISLEMANFTSPDIWHLPSEVACSNCVYSHVIVLFHNSLTHSLNCTSKYIFQSSVIQDLTLALLYQMLT